MDNIWSKIRQGQQNKMDKTDDSPTTDEILTSLLIVVGQKYNIKSPIFTKQIN